MARALRITGGRLRGRRLRAVPGEGTRPSMDAHRESLFAMLDPDLEGARVLDLFGGTGAFVLEAVSRGAREAVVVEKARAALGVLRGNVRDLLGDPASVRIVAGDAYRRPPVAGPFDVVFVAPPYPHFTERPGDIRGLVVRLIEGDAPLLASDGLLIVQYETRDFGPAQAPGYEVLRERTYGRTTFLILTPSAAPPGQEPGRKPPQRR